MVLWPSEDGSACDKRCEELKHTETRKEPAPPQLKRTLNSHPHDMQARLHVGGHGLRVSSTEVQRERGSERTTGDQTQHVQLGKKERTEGNTLKHTIST